MDKTSGKLTVFFEGPFWVGVFERISDGKLQVCKVTFGAEPRDCEVYDFILKSYDSLSFSKASPAEVRKAADNPKRRQRNAKKQLGNSGIGTKSQQALQTQREEMKSQRKKAGKKKKEAEKQYKYELKQQKRKEKHKGH